MKILLAADGSDYTRKAARYLAAHLSMFREAPEVFVHHVRAPLPYPGAIAAAGKSAVDEYQRQEAEAALNVACVELDSAGVRHVDSWTVGEVAPTLADFVAKHGIDMVVMGSRGHGALAGLALGSVTTKLLAMLKIPVVVVP